MKAVWPMDIYEVNKDSARSMVTLLESVSGREELKLYPTYVSSHLETRLNTAFQVDLKARYTTLPQRRLKAMVESMELGVPDSQISVVYEPGASLKAIVDRLVGHAQKKRADVIAVFTHARKGAARFFIGSFAETVMHRSPISVLMLSPKTRVKKQVRKILVASDLAPDSEKAFLAAVKNAKRARAKVVLFHAAEPLYDVKYSTLSGGAHARAYHDALDARVKKWTKKARALGVSVEVRIDSGWTEVSKAVLEAAKKTRADLIGVTAKTGPVSGLFLGSVSRRVIQESTLPVWVMRY